MRAHFTEHAFERHSHATYAIGITLYGVQAFTCRGTHHASRPGDVILFNPEQPHDGCSGSDDGCGFGYAMLYLEAALVRSWLERGAGTMAREHFKYPLVHDARAARRLHRATLAMAQRQESLRAEALTSAAVADLCARHGERPADQAACIDVGRARLHRVREYIDQHFCEDLGIDTLARAVGLSRIHLTRAFSQRFGMPPHAYLNTVRLRHAQRAILSGQPLVEAALAAGFADQSHFSRRFKGSMGVPPGAWLAQMGGARQP
jgi:AraC-like DNA-binding protein